MLLVVPTLPMAIAKTMGHRRLPLSAVRWERHCFSVYSSSFSVAKENMEKGVTTGLAVKARRPRVPPLLAGPRCARRTPDQHPSSIPPMRLHRRRAGPLELLANLWVHQGRKDTARGM